MKTASGLTVVAIGAILAFAVTRQPFFINLHIAGWALMLTGIAGMVIPRRGYGWLRRRTVVRRGPRGQIARVEDEQFPPYITINPESPPIEPSALGGDTDEFSPANGGVGEPPVRTDSYTEVRSGGYTEGHPPASAYRDEPPAAGPGMTTGIANPAALAQRRSGRGWSRLSRRTVPSEEMVEEFVEE
jgi:hypothetical protein